MIWLVVIAAMIDCWLLVFAFVVNGVYCSNCVFVGLFYSGLRLMFDDLGLVRVVGWYLVLRLALMLVVYLFVV